MHGVLIDGMGMGGGRDADDNAPRMAAYNLSNEKVKKLGLTLQPLEEVVRDTVAVLKEQGHLQ